MKVTRRKLAAAFAAPALAQAAAAAEQAQKPEPQQTELAKDRGELREMSTALAKISVPMTAEPAFQFKA